MALAAVSRPMTRDRRAIMGVRMAPGDADGAHIDQVTPGLPAAAAGVKTGDVIVQINDHPITGPDRMAETLGDHKPGDLVWLTVKRRQAEIGFLVKLTTDSGDGPRASAGTTASPACGTSPSTTWPSCRSSTPTSSTTTKSP